MSFQFPKCLLTTAVSTNLPYLHIETAAFTQIKDGGIRSRG